MKKYGIIDLEPIEKRIEELEEKLLMLQDQYKECYRKANIAYTNVLLRERYPNWKESKLSCLNEIALLKRILSQSADLTPEIEKAWEDGRDGTRIFANFPFVYKKYINKTSQDYISNLKLDI